MLQCRHYIVLEKEIEILSAMGNLQLSEGHGHGHTILNYIPNLPSKLLYKKLALLVLFFFLVCKYFYYYHYFSICITLTSKWILAGLAFG